MFDSVWCNFLPNNKILDRSKLKAFADNKIKVAKIKIFVFDREENNVGKGENAGYQHFLLFQQCFSKRLLSQGREKLGLCGKGLKQLLP